MRCQGARLVVGDSRERIVVDSTMITMRSSRAEATTKREGSEYMDPRGLSSMQGCVPTDTDDSDW